MAEGAVVHDATGAIKAANPSAERILGLTLAQLTGRKAIDPRWRLVMPDGRPATPEDIPSEITQRTGAPCRSVTLGVHKPSGELIWLMINTDLVLNPKTGKPWLIIATFTDISEEVRARKELIASEQKLQQSNVLLQAAADKLTARNREYQAALEKVEASTIAKSQFLANMSHELRTPLNAVVGFSDLILNAGVALGQNKVHEYVADIRNAGSLMVEIVDELLDISRLEIGALQTELQPVAIDRLIADAVRVSQIRAEEKKVAIAVQSACEGATAYCDAKLTRQALINVLVNAIKFSPARSTVRIAAELGQSAATIVVADAGRGFTREGLAHVFEPFWQGRDAASAGDGVGLGLTIAKRYLEASGGSIVVANAPEGGARVTVTLRRFKDDGEPNASQPPPAR